LSKTYHSLYWSFHRAVQPEGTSGALGGGGPDGGAKSDIEKEMFCGSCVCICVRRRKKEEKKGREIDGEWE
jgi:hypothetical protein